MAYRLSNIIIAAIIGFLPMPFPWSIVISLTVLAFALFIKHVGLVVVEDEHAFLWLIAMFFLVYVGSAVAVGSLNPAIIVNQGYLAASA
jgi:hypothetical protein